MNYVEVIIGILTVACMVYMVKTDARAKRKAIYERVEELEARVSEMEMARRIVSILAKLEKMDGSDDIFNLYLDQWGSAGPDCRLRPAA